MDLQCNISNVCNTCACSLRGKIAGCRAGYEQSTAPDVVWSSQRSRPCWQAPGKFGTMWSCLTSAISLFPIPSKPLNAQHMTSLLGELRLAPHAPSSGWKALKLLLLKLQSQVESEVRSPTICSAYTLEVQNRRSLTVSQAWGV